ncbi:hypothetical protein GCM10018781_56230 [Kitasatospora indigofera]|uniref:Uncharacterized protein n=1 Tax=Kitasatospora indigofera TaxID=67307 RepID=A0A919G7A2_9ACTN|nr:hypothetical protein GCM10018781_56230 [Kitasatospora indigofera]
MLPAGRDLIIHHMHVRTSLLHGEPDALCRIEGPPTQAPRRTRNLTDLKASQLHPSAGGNLTSAGSPQQLTTKE